MDENDPKDRPEFDVHYFQYVRDQLGNLVPVNFARRGPRRVPYSPPSMMEPVPPATESDSADYLETVGVVTYDLTPTERRCFLRVTEDGLSIAELAREERVSRAALYWRFRRMRAKNVFVDAWWARKNQPNFDLSQCIVGDEGGTVKSGAVKS
jgi:hypothetical protein